MQPLQLNDFVDYKFLSDLKTNPSQNQVVFQVTSCNEKENKYEHNLYLFNDEGIKQLTSSNQDSSFIFLNDEEILFNSSRDSDYAARKAKQEEFTCYYKLHLKGGEAIKAFEIPLNVIKINSIGNHQYLLLANYHLTYSTDCIKKIDEQVLADKVSEDDYKIFEDIPFYFNGAGFKGNSINRLFLYDDLNHTLQPISDTNISIDSFELKSTKDEVLFIYHQVNKQFSMKAKLAKLSLKDLSFTKLIDGMYLEDAYYYQDQILVIGNISLKHGFNENARFYLLDDELKLQLFYDNQQALGNSVGSDCRYGHHKYLDIIDDNIYFLTTLEDTCILAKLNGKAEYEVVYKVDGCIDDFTWLNKQLVTIAFKGSKLQEVYLNDIQQSTFNDLILKDKYVADYQEINYQNDGINFKGWVLLPKNYDPNKTYPAIFDIHGGPKTVYGKVFYHEMQVWANLGYFVFFTNPRGSDGRGNEFMDIFGKYGTIDYADLMCFVDEVLNKYPQIDPKRVGVTGGSYGGFMTNWIVTHTNRFACAATQRSISNWISFYGTSDIGMFFVEDQIHGNIYDSYDKLWQHSPLKYAKNNQTPTLFIHSDCDYRCPLEQGLQLYTAFVDNKIESRFVLFHGENHELSRSGQIKHRIKRLSEITNWMNKYLEV